MWSFTAPIELASITKETKYFVVVEAAAGLFDVGATTGDAEDAGKAIEWSIDNIPSVGETPTPAILREQRNPVCA